MTSIRCKACGKRYDYHKSDLCPNCGAYNKPSSRLRVDFDQEGNAELLNEKQFLQQSAAGRKRKDCYEQKECHEDKVRYSTASSGSGRNTRPLTGKGKTPEKRVETVFPGKRNGKESGSNFWYVVAVAAIFMLLRACVHI